MKGKKKTIGLGERKKLNSDTDPANPQPIWQEAQEQVFPFRIAWAEPKWPGIYV